MTNGAGGAQQDHHDPEPGAHKARPARQAIVEMELTSGKTCAHHAKAVRGTPDNPMTAQEIEDKATDLIKPIIGRNAPQAGAACGALDTLRSVRDLPLLQG